MFEYCFRIVKMPVLNSNECLVVLTVFILIKDIFLGGHFYCNFSTDLPFDCPVGSEDGGYSVVFR